MKVKVHGTLVYADGKLVKGSVEEVNRQIENGEQPTIESEGDAMRRVASDLGFSFANSVIKPTSGTARSPQNEKGT